MKLKRLLACALAMALCVTMMALPAAAATFPDIQTHWGKSYIEAMTDKGMFKGYEDGNFKPERELTAGEALALCARAVPLEASVAAKIATDRLAEIKTLLNGDQSWFYREFAICLETGILSYTDLKDLFQTGALTKPIAKQDLSRYLVRAMQLGPRAERLESFNTSFNDVADISIQNQPYIYLLNIYGIVQGDPENKFLPTGKVTRAVMATMLSRSLEFMDDRGTVVDLPAYTTYDFRSGTIAAVSAGDKGIVLLTLTNDLTGQTYSTLSLAADVKVYENNMTAATAALKVGRHVRVALDSKGTATTIWVGDGLEAFSGKVSGIDGDSVALTVDGVGKIVTMDRFTQVQVGGKTVGGPSLVDATAGYTNAVCQIDDQDRLVAIQFTGGTRAETGIFSSVEKGTGSLAGSQLMRVLGFDGVTRQYTVPTGAAVLVNGVGGALGSGYQGCYVSMRVSNEDNTAVSVTVDTVTKYVQGAVRGVAYSTATNTLTVSDIVTGKSVTYNVPTSAVITYNDQETQLKEIKKEYFVTGRLSGSDLVRIDAYPGATVVEGVITNRAFDVAGASTLTLEVTQEDKSVINYKLDLLAAPDVKRDGAKSTVDKLRVGDEVTVTVRYSVVTLIEATAQTANAVGIIDRIIQDVGGSTLEMTLTDGTKASYLVTSATSITQGGKPVLLSALKPGYRLGMVVSGDQVSSIEVQQAVDPTGQITGTVITVSASARQIYLRVVDSVGNEQLINVNVPSGASIIDLNTGKTIYLKDLSYGDVLQVNGVADGADFTAKVILRQ